MVNGCLVGVVGGGKILRWELVRKKINGRSQVITFTAGRKIRYTYTASGTKLKVESLMNSTLLRTTEYIGGMVYEDGALKFFGSPEGRVVKNGSDFDYQYAIADHQACLPKLGEGREIPAWCSVR